MAVELAHYVQDLCLILGTATLTGLASHALRQPPVLGYLLAGMLVGPHVPGLVLDRPETLELTLTLSELGVILLMFSIGLEFSLRKMARIGPAAGLTAVFEIALMMTLGFLTARLLGWDALPSLFIAACLASSSTMIAAKTFESQKLRGGFVDLTFAILVFDDMATILVLAVLTAVAAGAGLSPWEFALSVGQLGGFLVALLAGGLFVVPRAVRLVARRQRSELTLLACVAICFAMASLAGAAGYSVALGAFVAGLLVSESGEGATIEPLISPLRDLFAALFFISIGMQIDPLQVVSHAPLVLAFTAVVLVGKLVGVSTGAFLSGNGVKVSVRAGMSCAHNGEFSFIMAAIGISAGVLGEWIFPVAVGVSVLTQLTTPFMVGRSERVALAIERRLPARVQTFVTFYEAWIEQLRSAPRTVSLWRQLRRDVVFLVLDAALALAVLVGSHAIQWRAVTMLIERFSLPPGLVDVLWIAATLAVAGIFLLGVVRKTIALARRLAEMVLPVRPGEPLDLGSAPRRAFFVVLELGLGLVVGLPLVALAQPFLPLSAAPMLLALVVAVLLYSASRTITNLHGHVSAGSELIVEVLARQSHEDPGGEPDGLAGVQALLPGFPDMTPVRLTGACAAVGRSLVQLDLRVQTGATVLALAREGVAAGVVSPRDPLRAGDILTLTGSQDAVAAALKLLRIGDPRTDPELAAPAQRAV